WSCGDYKVFDWYHEWMNVRSPMKTWKHWTVVSSCCGTPQQFASTMPHVRFEPRDFSLASERLI
ncbi:unnamed protein product, partial [Schistosoma haematobium]